MILDAARKLDRLGYGQSPAHHLDGRAKILAAFTFAVTVASFPKYSVVPILPLAIIPFLLAWFGDTPFCVLGRMLLIACPFALLVGLLNPFFDRAPVFIGGHVLAAGWLSYGSILVRFALSMTMLTVLVATTALPDLLRGLRQLKVPAALVTQLQFLYRYLFLLADEAARLSRARRLREPARVRADWHTARAILGSLLWRATGRAERIYLAMQARGFDGDMPERGEAHWGAADLFFLAAVIACCLLVRFAIVWSGP
jgi:cobalt/nickel transport system permease protein